MPVDSATYHSLLNNCIDPDGPVHWLTAELITATCIDGSSIVLPIGTIDRLEPVLAVTIRLKLTPLHAVIMEPRRTPATSYAAGTADTALLEGA